MSQYKQVHRRFNRKNLTIVLRFCHAVSICSREVASGHHAHLRIHPLSHLHFWFHKLHSAQTSTSNTDQDIVKNSLYCTHISVSQSISFHWVVLSDVDQIVSGVGGSIFGGCFDANADHRRLRRSECMETWDKECENGMQQVPRVSTAALVTVSEGGSWNRGESLVVSAGLAWTRMSSWRPFMNHLNVQSTFLDSAIRNKAVLGANSGPVSLTASMILLSFYRLQILSQ